MTTYLPVIGANWLQIVNDNFTLLAGAELIELASDAETITGTDAAKGVTPAGLQAKVSSATAKGIVELATDAETITGTDTARAVTPANVAAKLANLHAGEVRTASFVIGAEGGGTTINVAIQLKDIAAADLAVRGSVMAYLSNDANGDSIATTAPSGGWAIGTDGLLIPIVAGKAAQLISESDGDIDVTLTEAGVATWYLILVLPNGKLIASTAITFA